MLCNGLPNAYEDVVKAVELHHEAYVNTGLTYSDDLATFYNACSGTSRKNMEFRYIILSRIINKINQNVLESVNFDWESQEVDS